jgi:hypothetical protein
MDDVGESFPSQLAHLLSGGLPVGGKLGIKILVDMDDDDFIDFLVLMSKDQDEGLALLFDDLVTARVARLNKIVYRSRLLPALRTARRDFNAYDYAEHLKEHTRKSLLEKKPPQPTSDHEQDEPPIDSLSTVYQLAAYWGIPIRQVIRHGDENIEWSLKLDDGREILIGSTKQLDDQKHIRSAIFERTGVRIPRISKQEDHKWDQLLVNLYAMSVSVENLDGTRKEQTQQLLRQYLDNQPGGFVQDFDDEEWEALALKNRPFRKDARLYVHARSFWHNMVRMMAPDITYNQTLGLLRLVGAQSTRITLNKIAHTDRSFWILPKAFLGGWHEPT